jgi:hypothetical protein
VRLEIGLVGEDLVEDEMSRRLAVLLQEIDEVLGVAASLPGLARTSATTE